jgi:putative ABC transport system permease protein
VHDYKLGLRMLLKYPGLTLAGGLALAIAIGIGAGWYDFSGDLFRPKMPLPQGDRIVEIEMRNAVKSEDEGRLLHEFVAWRQHVTLINDLAAYRTLERNLILPDAAPVPVAVAEISASAFRVAGIAPMLGRALVEADEQPGAEPVAVIGYGVWQRQFGGHPDVVGRTVHLGRLATTVIGVMPEGFAFPVNHRLWIPLQLRPTYAPLEGPAIRIFGQLAAGASQEQAYAELMAMADREAAASPETHQHLRPRVLAYGGQSPGDQTILEFVIRHLPILLILVIACVNVGTLIYARTATREAEIALRCALGASRGQIVGQLFVEALVLASISAIVGLSVAHWGVKWAVAAYHTSQGGEMPFWLKPGLKATTVLFAAGLTLVAAAMLSVLPALKATGARVQTQLKNLGAGGSTLQFGKVWTTAMIAQVALTMITIPPAMGIGNEAWRDRVIRDQFPTERYLAVRIGLDREGQTAAREQSPAESTARLNAIYHELERRIAEEPGVESVTFGDRLPGMGVAVRTGEVETSPTTPPTLVPNLWLAAVGPRFFETFEIPLLAGRDFHDGDRVPGARTVLVNEAFARRYADSNAVGRRVRYASEDPVNPEPWLEIVGVVRDVGMTPTDLGEGPYIFHAASPTTAFPLVMGVRIAGDPAAVAQRVRAIAGGLDAELRLDEVRSLDDHAWRIDLPNMIGASAIAGVVILGLFLSAAGIFSLMSVSVARRMREIGLRAALGASPMRLLANIFSRAVVLIGSGIVAGNAVLLLFVNLGNEITLAEVWGALVTTSAVMLAVGLLACIEPAWRALRIDPTTALKDA